jgi:hypothetical protein
MYRANRIVRFVLLLLASWFVMTLTHEVGHIAGGWCGGASLIEFDLAPWRLPYSLHHPDPHPLLTLWAGPIAGVLVPCAVAAAVRHPYSWFVADFCLLANGTYLALSWISGDRYLDTPRLLDAGAWPVAIAIYCTLTIGLGYSRFRRDCMATFSITASPPTFSQPQA